MTINVLPEITTLFLLLFARLGTLVMLLPPFGEQAVSMRTRLGFALLLTLIFFPSVSPTLPQGLTGTAPALLVAMVGEILIGLAFGMISRLLLAVGQIAGTIIANEIGLGFAQTVDPTMGQQGAILASFISVTGMTLIFVADLHHIAIAGIADSYRMFPPGEIIPLADYRDAAVMAVSESFRIGLQISAPFIVFSLIFNLGLGVLSKLMPQLQVFFLAMPLSIFIGIILFAFLIGTIMTLYVGHVETGLMRLLVP